MQIFQNEFDASKEFSLLDVLKWKLLSKNSEVDDEKLLEVEYTPHLLNSDSDFICWLSHASFLIQLKGKRFLVDPVFADIPFYKRKSKFPYSIDEIGRVDFLLITHAHYDHFDRKSIKAFEDQKPTFIVPKGFSRYLKKGTLFQELSWFEKFEVDKDITIYFVPAKHWSRRSAFDKNRALWGGFIFQKDDQTIYHAGDTSYDKHFKDIAKKFDIDYALLPVGAYEPQFIMKHNHLDPNEAVKAFYDLGAQAMIPMHFGTFRLSDETLQHQIRWVEKIEESENAVKVLKPGEVLFI